MPHQSFIVVRPPPSKTSHPLNLQIQLLPTKDKDASRSAARHRSRSSDGSIGDDDGTADGLLTLPDANRSAISMYSSVSSYSTTSLTSVASTSSASAGGRRAIVPLYNLQAHSVLASTVVDAGTDAKVAKFHKRGLELVGLATMEAVEVWGGNSDRCPAPTASGLPNKSTLTLADSACSARESAEPARSAHTPASSLSAFSDTSAESSATSAPLSTPLPLTACATTPVTPTSPPKRFLGKLFKRPASEPRANADPHLCPGPTLDPFTAGTSHPLQHASAPLLTAAILTAAIGGGNPNPVASCSSFSVSSSSLSVAGLPSPPPSEPRISTSTGARESAPTAGQRPSVLGVQPALSSRTQPPCGRPTKYVWIVRKWHKHRAARADFGSLSGTKEKPGARDAASASCAVESLVEVRFEWARADKRRRSGNRQDKREDRAEKTTDVRSGIVPASARTASTTDRDREGCSPDEEGAEAEADSEPEDSETPWACTLVLRRRSASRSAPLQPMPPCSSPNSANTVRVKVARMVPTPHHPKIVALFKAPFSLPDVDVARLDVRKRDGAVVPPPIPATATPAASDGSRPGTSRGRSQAAGGGTGRSKKSLRCESSTSETQLQDADAELELNAELGGLEPARRGLGLESDWPGAGLVLTAEEIKDVVASTALWLVVREGFGGVGRVSRKGDRSWGVW
ncbi:hypothetical protein C8Q80DRAFT_1356476 [Daedaleopsis nitida]|nr:hypothetical protein C8Q80DRAFT_1356476 [Daedaleopsis nitida]